MMQQILLIAGIVGLLIFIRWVRYQPRQKQIQAISILCAVVLLGLALTGRLHWLFALFAAIVPILLRVLSLLSYAPLIGRLFTQFRNINPNAHASQASTVKTDYLEMNLDHATGEMNGSVLYGPYVGKNLHDLSITQLIELYKDLTNKDNDSAHLLEAYLDRKYKDTWREDLNEEDFTKQQPNQQSAMTTEEAYNVLGLKPDATQDDIINAHRRLMQKLHPDRGGNDYLATKINQAKDLLLKKAA